MEYESTNRDVYDTELKVEETSDNDNE